MELLVVVPSDATAAMGSATLRRAQEVAGAAGVQCHGGIVSGHAPTVVPKRMSEVEADLLVTGIPPEQTAHGRLGDAVETLVAEVSCPTLLVGVPAAA
jgi:nucleotide-binding universal stress UspA family protein